MPDPCTVEMFDETFTVRPVTVPAEDHSGEESFEVLDDRNLKVGSFTVVREVGVPQLRAYRVESFLGKPYTPRSRPALSEATEFLRMIAATALKQGCI